MGRTVVNSRKLRFALAVGAAAGFVTIATPASAGTGCNGVINPFVWGCAPWDNNNGPNFPYFKKSKITIPKAQAQIFNEKGAQMVKDLRTGAVHPLIGQAGGNVIATGGGN